MEGGEREGQMAGLGLLLETHQHPFPNCPQIISKATLFIKNSTPPLRHPSPFLEHCFLCRQRLLVGKDIYMYRGDRAFCSEECRCRHILIDEEAVADAFAASSSSSSAARRPGKSRSRAGGFL